MKTDRIEQAEIVKEMRQDCLDSLYMFSKLCCGFTKFKIGLHDDMCDFLQHEGSIRKMLLAPRDHFKSSVVQAFILWRICRNPEERVLIAGDTANTAQKKLTKVKAIIQTSETLRALFPEIVPRDLSKIQWSESEITLPRKGAHAEPTISALGVGGARAGAHYTLIVCDDICTKEAKDQPSTLRKTIEWFNGLEAMLESVYQNTVVLVGTPWVHDDVHDHASRSWGRSNVPGFYEEMVMPFFNEEQEPIFPELYDPEGDPVKGRENALDFARRTKEVDPYLWSCNFDLKPSVPNAEFNMDQLQYYTTAPNGQYLLYYEDDNSEPTIVPSSGMLTYIAVDPAFKKDASASKASINVSSVAADGRVFIRESIGIRGGTYKLIDEIERVCRKYEGTLSRLGIERVGQQQAFIDFLAKELRQRGVYKRVEGLTPGSTKDKPARIRSHLQPYFAQRKVWLRVEMAGLIDEFQKFPLSDIRDELDAMAYAAQYFWMLNTPNMERESQQSYMERFRDSRATASQIAGY